MATLSRRADIVIVNNGGSLFPGSGYIVTVYSAGSQVAANGSASPLTLYEGHGFEVGDRLMVGVDTTTYRTVSSLIGSTQVAYSGTSMNVVTGDIVMNLGDDTGSSTPTFVRSTVDPAIYSDLAGVNAISQATVTCDANGNYRYWFAGGSIWELVRSPQGVPKDVIQNAPSSSALISRVASLPSTAAPGTIVILDQGTGQPDIYYVYVKFSNDTYDWLEVISAA